MRMSDGSDTRSEMKEIEIRGRDRRGDKVEMSGQMGIVIISAHSAVCTDRSEPSRGPFRGDGKKE